MHSQYSLGPGIRAGFRSNSIAAQDLLSHDWQPQTKPYMRDFTLGSYLGVAFGKAEALPGDHLYVSRSLRPKAEATQSGAFWQSSRAASVRDVTQHRRATTKPSPQGLPQQEHCLQIDMVVLNAIRQSGSTSSSQSNQTQALVEYHDW